MARAPAVAARAAAPIFGFAACSATDGRQTEEPAPEGVSTHEEAVGTCSAECWCDEYGYCTFRVEGGPEGCGEAGFACCDAIGYCEDVPNQCPWEETCETDWDCGWWGKDCIGNCCVGVGS